MIGWNYEIPQTCIFSVLDDDTIHKYFLKQKEIPLTRGVLDIFDIDYTLMIECITHP